MADHRQADHRRADHRQAKPSWTVFAQGREYGGTEQPVLRRAVSGITEGITPSINSFQFHGNHFIATPFLLRPRSTEPLGREVRHSATGGWGVGQGEGNMQFRMKIAERIIPSRIININNNMIGYNNNNINSDPSGAACRGDTRLNRAAQIIA